MACREGAQRSYTSSRTGKDTFCTQGNQRGGEGEGAEKDVKGAITESNSNNHVSEQKIECKQCLGIHVQFHTGLRNQ